MLGTYPVYELPHPEHRTQGLNAAQAQANLTHLRAALPHRLQFLGTLLGEFGIDLHTGLNARDPRRLLHELHTWSCQHWPSVFERRLADAPTWRTSHQAGRNIVYSLLTDVGLLLGQLIVRHHPEYVWSVDIEEKRRHRTTFRRTVVLRSKADGRSTENWDVADVLEWAFRQYWEMGTPGASTLSNRWMEQVLEFATRPSDTNATIPLARLRPHLQSQTPSPRDLGIFDRATDHLEVMEAYGLNWERAAHPAWFFLRWIVEQNLLAKELSPYTISAVRAFRRQHAPIADVYASMHWTLKRRYFSRQGARFARHYFRLDRGSQFCTDLTTHLARDAPSIFHVDYTEHNYRLLCDVFASRFTDWRTSQHQQTALRSGLAPKR